MDRNARLLCHIQKSLRLNSLRWANEYEGDIPVKSISKGEIWVSGSFSRSVASHCVFTIPSVLMSQIVLKFVISRLYV